MMKSPTSLPTAASTRLRWAASSAAVGLWVSGFCRISVEFFGVGPLVTGLLAAAVFGAFGLSRAVTPGARGTLAAALVACAPLATPDIFGAFALPMVPFAAISLGLLSCLACAQLLSRQSTPWNMLSSSIAAGAFGLGAVVGSGAALVGGSVTLAVLGAFAQPAPAGSGADRAVASVSSGARTFVLTVLLVLAMASLALVRSPLCPAPAGTAAFAAALFVAASVPAGRATAVIGAALAGGAVYTAERLPVRMGELTGLLAQAAPVLAEGDHPALIALALAGAAAGLLVGLTRAAAREVGVATVVAGLSAPLLTALVDTKLAEHSGSALVTVGADVGLRSRLDGFRAKRPLQLARSGPFGGEVIRGADANALLAELDGSVVELSPRLSAGERFAGTLAGCLTSGRAHARVGGDDLGLVTSALLAQRFVSVDTALPSPAFTRAWADLDPVAKSAWVSPATRILSWPANALVALGEPADAVVQVVRNGWTDARSSMPSARTLRGTRRSLSPGGVYVLSVSTTRLDAADFHGLAAELSRSFPSVTAWLPPAGIDSALFVARDATTPLEWSGLARCLQADAQRLRRDALRTPEDIASLLLGDGTTLATGLPAPTGLRLPQRLNAGDPSPLAGVRADGWDPASAWSADAPRDDLRARHASLLRFQAVIAQAATGDMPGAIEAARDLSATPGGDRSVETLVRGYLDAARVHISAAKRAGPDSKEWGAAETALGNVRLLYPELAEAWCVQGALDTARGQWQRAEAAYGTCNARDPESREALDGLASTRLAVGNFTGAEDALKEAVSRHPDQWDAQYNLGRFYLLRGRMDAAEPLLRQAVAGAARDGGAARKPHLALADLYLATDRAVLALGEAQQVASRAPDSEALRIRGMARFDLDQVDLAEADFREALRLEPGDVKARTGLAQVQLRREDYDGAAESLKAVLQADPQNRAAQENLARLRELGKTEE